MASSDVETWSGNNLVGLKEELRIAKDQRQESAKDAAQKFRKDRDKRGIAMTV